MRTLKDIIVSKDIRPKDKFDLVLARINEDPDNDYGDTLLHFALQSEQINFIKLPKELYNNHKNQQGNTPLHIAVMKNNTIAIERLIENEMFNDEKNNKGDTPITIAARNLSRTKDTRILELLTKAFKDQQQQIDKNSNIQQNNNTWQNRVENNSQQNSQGK